MDTKKGLFENRTMSLLAFHHKNRIKTSLNLIGTNQKVLDIGCNDGAISELIKNNNNTVYGIDGSSNQLEKAEKRGIITKKHDLEKKLPFEDNSFDCVFAGEIIEHIYDVDSILTEIKRVLKKGGIFVLSVPNLVSFRNRIRMLFGIKPFYFDISLKEPFGCHIKGFTKNSLKKVLQENGFNIDSIKGIIVCFSLISRKPKRVFSSILLGKIFPSWAEFIIVKAIKN